METVKVTFKNGDTNTTSINGSNESISEYYAVGNMFNIGSGEDDNVQPVISLEFIN